MLGDLDLGRLAEVEVDVSARLRNAQAGRAIFEVPGGVLVFGLDEFNLLEPGAASAGEG